MASAIGTPPPSPRQAKGSSRQQPPSPPPSSVSSLSPVPPPPPPPSRPRPVPIAHDITSLLLSLQGLFQRLSPYVSPTLHFLAFVLTWQNKFLSASVVAAYCALVLVGWDVAALHLPFAAGIIGLGYAYAKRLGRGVSPPLVNPPPPSIPHLLHTLISATSSLHSAADRLDSLVTLVTFTRKSETASLALFRAVIVAYAIVVATVFCIGLRTVVLIAGVVALCWGSDFAQVAKAVAVIQIQDLCKQMGIEMIQWVDEDDDEDLATTTTTARQILVRSAEQDKVDAVRRGSESAARQLMGVPPKTSGVRRRAVAAGAPATSSADGGGPAPAPVKRLVKVVPKSSSGAGVVKKPLQQQQQKPTPAAAASTIIPPARKSSSEAGPALLAKSTAAAAAAAAGAGACPAAPSVTISTANASADERIAPEHLQTSSPTELSAADSATLKLSAVAGNLESAGTTIHQTPRRTSATSLPSSSSSPEPQDRLKSRLEHIVRTSRGTPSPTSSIPEAASEGEKASAVANDSAVALVETLSVPVPDESNVLIDKHRSWALPSGDSEEEITDDFRRALSGIATAGENKLVVPQERAEDNNDDRDLVHDDDDDDDDFDTHVPIETDYMNVELDQATDAFHQQMMREEEEEEANTLDNSHFLRHRRSCDSDLTIDALANFSDPRRSSYTATAQNLIGLPGSARKTRALSNGSQSTLSTLSSDTTSSTAADHHTGAAAATAAPGRYRSVSDLDAKMGRYYSITDPIPQHRNALSSIATSSLTTPTSSLSTSPSPLSPTPSSVTGSSSRSSIRGANRRPLNVVLSFDTYENQRWWVGVGWVPHLLPTERGAWTDHAGRKDTPKSSFDLPEFRREQLEKIDQEGSIASTDGGGGGSSSKRPGSLPIPDLPVDMASHRYAWDWDGAWHIDMLGTSSGATDDDGWEYGDNFWSGWKKRKTLKRVVRRRRWVRLARLYEVGRKRSVTFGGSYVFDKDTTTTFEGVPEEESHFRPSAAQLRQTFTPTWPEVAADDMSFVDEEYNQAAQQQARRDSNPSEYDDYEDGGGGGAAAEDEDIGDGGDDDDGTRIEYPPDEELDEGQDEYAGYNNHDDSAYLHRPQSHHHRPHDRHRQLHHHHHPQQQQEYYHHADDDDHRTQQQHSSVSTTTRPPQPRRRDTGPPQFASLDAVGNAAAGGGSARRATYAEPRYYPEQ
ncbi:hypothetical protein HDU86_006594 [Geranomyces michiganensis]|nr:hypothetical protein HDU86_006594 [Geranomyces michiganensis]